eukprot:4818536-Amphidinium_carterae.1
MSRFHKATDALDTKTMVKQSLWRQAVRFAWPRPQASSHISRVQDTLHNALCLCNKMRAFTFADLKSLWSDIFHDPAAWQEFAT